MTHDLLDNVYISSTRCTGSLQFCLSPSVLLHSLTPTSLRLSSTCLFQVTMSFPSPSVLYCPLIKNLELPHPLGFNKSWFFMHNRINRLAWKSGNDLGPGVDRKGLKIRKKKIDIIQFLATSPFRNTFHIFPFKNSS